MALKTAYSFRGIAVPEAYVRLDSVSGGKRIGRWTGEFSIYQSDEAANPPQPKISSVAAVALPDGLAPPPLPVAVSPQPALAGFSITIPWVEDEHPEPALYRAAKEQEMLASATDA